MSEPSTPSKEIVETSGSCPTVPITIAVNLPARIHRDDDGAVWADVPSLPGCVAGGASLDEVLSNLREAAEGWLLAKNDIETIGWPTP